MQKSFFFFIFSFQPPGSLLLSVTSHKVDFSRSTYGKKKINPHRVREKSVKKMYVGERDILEIFLHRKIKIKICLGKENHNDVISSTGRSIVTLREFRFFFFKWKKKTRSLSRSETKIKRSRSSFAVKRHDSSLPTPNFLPL